MLEEEKKEKKEKKSFKFTYTMEITILAKNEKKAFKKFNSIEFSKSNKTFKDIVCCEKQKSID